MKDELWCQAMKRFFLGALIVVFALVYCTRGESKNRCKRPKFPRNSIINYINNGKGNRIHAGTRISFGCKKGFVLVGPRRTRCLKNGRWTAATPICLSESIKCSDPEMIVNGMVTVCDRRLFSSAKYKCHKDYELVGQSTRKCFPTTKWSGKPPRCIKKRCPPPKGLSLFKNGSITIENPKFEVSSKITFNCGDGYSTIPGNTMTCTSDQTWKPSTIPKCQDYGVCGKGKIKTRGRIAGGSRVIRTGWPWQVAIYRDSLFICGGSLVKDDIVLTAANCLTTSPLNISTDAGRYKVIVGENKIVIADDAKMMSASKKMLEFVSQKGKDVKKIFPHLFYDPIRFENDIALFQLREPVRWSPRVRPVCLPTPSQFVVPNTFGYVAGWGFTNQSQLSGELINVALRIRDNVTCKLSRPRNEAMFCAGEGDGKKSTCRGDGGGPFVIEYPDYLDKTSSSYSVVGIVSSGPSCGAMHRFEFEYYTRVGNYLDWIKSTISKMK